MSITDEILNDLPADVANEIRGQKKSPRAQTDNVTQADPFRKSNAIDTVDVCNRLGIDNDGTHARCPGCGEDGAAVALDKPGFKCLHARCSTKGKAGWRSNVDLVAEVQGVSAVDAVNWLAEQFGFEGVRAKRVRESVSRQSHQAPSPGIGPTADDPMRGLAKLGAVAIVGRARILELAAKPVVYLWQDIALAGIIVVLAGGPGSGKTTLLFLVLIARANLGEPIKVLGRTVTPAPPGTFVVLIEAEHGDSSAARKLLRSCRLLGVDDQALDRVILVARRSVRIGSPEWLEVGHMVAAGLVSDIALDTLARVAPADANNEQEQVAIFEQVAQTIERAPSEETRPVVWTVAHKRKGDTVDLDDVGGSTQRTGQADTVLMVTAERSDGRVTSSKATFAKLREEPDEYPLPVEYTVTADRVVYIDAPPADDRPIEERILEQLTLGEPTTKTALSRALRRNKPDLESAISNLFKAKLIRSCTVTVNGRSFAGFELRPADLGGAR